MAQPNTHDFSEVYAIGKQSDVGYPLNDTPGEHEPYSHGTPIIGTAQDCVRIYAFDIDGQRRLDYHTYKLLDPLGIRPGRGHTCN